MREESFAVSQARSDQLWTQIQADPRPFRVLTGDRATGALHVGHFFGSLENRLRLQTLGVSLNVVIADYQALTDREASAHIEQSVLEIALDYLAVGLDPNNERTLIFVHSCVASLNQLFLPFLSLVTAAELQRNPTVKDEIKQLGARAVSGLMLTYPAHQAADILSCHGNLVPGGRDQMPHLELTRTIARRFNEHYGDYFTPPDLLLSAAPLLLGLDGRKMSKSLGNAIPLSLSADETAARIKLAKTDAERAITYEPARRPEVSNLVFLAALCLRQAPERVAAEIGDGGGGKLKQVLTEAVNERFRELRIRRQQLARDLGYVRDVLHEGNQRAEAIAAQTLREVHAKMRLVYTHSKRARLK